MVDIRHRVGIKVPKEAVFEALTTLDGIANWWTRDAKGDASLGGNLQFYFGQPEPSAVMEVVDVKPNDRVVWRCTGGPDEWLNTRLDFVLQTSDTETVLLFTHANWKEPVEFMYHCSTKWGQFLVGLKVSLERWTSSAFPDDLAISSWG
ncbi:MAG TPA: SRPBCC domain-containing protein [Acidimicrobiales bacterium]|jgi:uncharacterized protein YndB with AHSA1/START domain|nr:SRPBCC domain-containing protein [Acidimicrobiales bacterium]